METTLLSPLVKVEEATRVYRVDGQEVVALKGVSLEVARGTFLALKGRSGSGKTTLLNLIGGLDRPTSGSVTFDGQDLSAFDEQALTLFRRHRVGFIFQSFALFPTYSAFENVDLMLRLTGLGRKPRIERTMNALQLVGLTQWKEHRPDEMSGGQQQRVAIARAIANLPDLILADEPTGELDSETTHQIFALFRHLVDTEKLTILAATHDPIIDEYADTVYLLNDGLLMKGEEPKAISDST